jgi:transposase InsO family protein
MSKASKYNELRESVKRLRRQLVGLNSDTHWISLNKKVRGALDQAFEFLDNQTVGEVFGIPEEIIGRWRKQKNDIDKLRAEAADCRDQNKSGNLSKTVHLRPKVARLARISTSFEAARVLGISRNTVKRWLDEGWDKVKVEDLRAMPATVGSPEIADIKINEMMVTPEAKQLEHLVARHKGKLRRKYSVIERKLILELTDRFGSKAIHDYFKVSFDTIARLRQRAEQDVNRKPRTPLRYAPVIEIMKRNPGMGPMQIRDYIHRHHGLSMGVNSVRKVMEQNGWVPPYVRTPRVKDEIKFYEAIRRNYLWHADFKHHYVGKCKVFVLFLQDDYSRFIVGHMTTDGEKIEPVILTIDEAIRLHGRPEIIMTDGGSAFYSWRGISQVTRFFEDYGIDQHIAKTPNINGKLENLNQQVEKELFNTITFSSLKHFENDVASWVGHYNFMRPHQGIGGNMVPADRFYPGAARWFGESGDITRKQSLIAETMAALLMELKKK